MATTRIIPGAESHSAMISMDGTRTPMDVPADALNSQVFSEHPATAEQRANPVRITDSSSLRFGPNGVEKLDDLSDRNQAITRMPDGSVKLPNGMVTDARTAEILRQSNPEMFQAPAAEAPKAQAPSPADADMAAEAHLIANSELLNTHPDAAVEAFHQALVHRLPAGAQQSLMAALSRGEEPNAAAVGRALGVSAEEAAAGFNAVRFGLNAQFEMVARSMGLDPAKAGAWIAENKADTAATVLQAHALRRSAQSWVPLLRLAKQAGV